MRTKKLKEKDVKLYDAIKSSYGDEKSKRELIKAGYVLDTMLSNHNEDVWFNPKQKKLLINIAGTHNLSDIATDIYLMAGKLKNTNRYKHAKKTLENGRKNINEVMYDVGYSDTKAFRAIFRKITGLSPIEYRNKYNKEALAVA